MDDGKLKREAWTCTSHLTALTSKPSIAHFIVGAVSTLDRNLSILENQPSGAAKNILLIGLTKIFQAGELLRSPP